MLIQPRRRWANIKTIFVQRLFVTDQPICIAGRCCLLALHGRIKVYFFNFILYSYYVYRFKLYSKTIIFPHFTCIAHMYTTHNFKMLHVYIDDIMGGLHASNLVVSEVFDQ